jgi:hypothetical protein
MADANGQLDDVLTTLGQAISAAINAAGFAPPGQTFKGQILSTELAKILGKGQGNYAIALFPGADVNETCYSPGDRPVPTPAPQTLTVSQEGDQLTFGGTLNVDDPVNVHMLLNGHSFVVQYPSLVCWLDAVVIEVPTGSAGTIAEFVATIAADINAAAISGVTATAVEDTLTTDGLHALSATIAGVGSVQYEVGRFKQLVQVSVYAPDPLTRLQVGDAIRRRVGSASAHVLTLSDGITQCPNFLAGGKLVEKAQSSYGAFEWHFGFDVTYPIVEVVETYEVGVVALTTTVAKFSPVKSFVGGTS